MSLLLLDSFGASAPTVAPPLAFVHAFADLVERVDRSAQILLGGEPVIYQSSAGVSAEVTCIFDEVYVLAQGDPDAGVETIGPAVFVRLEDLPIDPELDEPTLVIRGLDYRVTERRPDGIGGIVLAVRKRVSS